MSHNGYRSGSLLDSKLPCKVIPALGHDYATLNVYFLTFVADEGTGLALYGQCPFPTTLDKIIIRILRRRRRRQLLRRRLQGAALDGDGRRQGEV